MEKNQFKPFDQVLVRDFDSEPWKCSLFSHKTENDAYFTIDTVWNQCIPYNEETAHLINTKCPYEPAEPKEYHVSWHLNSKTQWVEYTAKEFENFIKTAVIHNKDISNFTVRHINN